MSEINHDTCRSRSAKDQYRISTLNMSKKELEDIYYSLFDNNLELKKTINVQRDQIKVLTTRLSRLTQKNIYSPQKGCSKNTLNEHKEIIIDLKQANEKLVERVRLLNMQLCSAKQFVKRNPLQTARCQNCANIRNSSSITLLNTKRSQLNLMTKSTASQYEPDITPILLEETIKGSISNLDQEECTQNKCKTALEELQNKIDELQKELLKVVEHNANESKKFTDYENVLSGLKEENLRVRSLARVCEEKLQSQRKEYLELLKKLRTVEAQNETVSLELVLEKQKCRELETQLRAAEISHDIVQALTEAAMRANESREPVRVECLTPVRADESITPAESESHKPAKASLIPVRVNESLTPMRSNECVTPMRSHESLAPVKGNESLTPMRSNECLTPMRSNESLAPMRSNESLTPVGVDESPVTLGDTPNKVEHSDDSGYLEATNKYLEQSADTILETITEQPRRKEELPTNTLGDDLKRKKRKGRSRKNRRDNSMESSVDGNPSEDLEQPKSYTENTMIVRKVLQDVGVQSTVECVSRAAGDLLEGARTDAEVQIGDSLCAPAVPEVDTRTYSRRSSRTYSVHAAPAPAHAPPPAPAPADNTDCEISSLSELPSERDLSRSDYISPGEAVTSTDTGASSWSELSEGELPLPVTRHKLSYGEVDSNMSIGEHKPPVSPSVRIDRAMRAAKEEADRVARLLAGRPVDLSGVTVNPLALLRPRYQ